MSWLTAYQERRTFKLLKRQLEALNARLLLARTREIARHAKVLAKPFAFVLNTSPDEVLREQHREMAQRWVSACDRYATASRNGYDPALNLHRTSLMLLRIVYRPGLDDWLARVEEATQDRKAAVQWLFYLSGCLWTYRGDLSIEERRSMREGIRILKRSLRGQWRAIREEEREEREKAYLTAEQWAGGPDTPEAQD